MPRNIFCSVYIIIVLCHHFSVNGDANFKKFHLPGFISPLKYDLTINADPNDEIIDHKGDVRITIKCTSDTKEIIVNRKSLEIEELEVKVMKLINGKEEGTVDVGGHDYNLYLDRYTITLKEGLEKDKFYVVVIPFFKKIDINQPYEGYIKRTYESVTTPASSKPLVYTKMGRIDARGIFPGLDQIDIKVPFRIKLQHPKSMIALSNANKDFDVAVPGKPDWILDVFKETVAMTTYSVTMELLEFVSKKTTEPSSNVEIRVWSDPAVSELIDYVFPVAFHSLKFYFELFNVPYGFEKLDVVILPDPIVKAWESYGLIILGQEFVMKTITKSRTEYELVSNFVRTVSQQWLDYRVTLVWWDQDWLHRGLNRFLQTVCVNQIFPEWEFSNSAWDIVDSFVQIQKNEIKGIYSPILTLDEFPTDSLDSENMETHEKIHQLIRMTYFFLGSNIFRERIQTYANTYEFTHSSLPQVWKAFGKTPISEKDDYISESFSVEEILKTWLNQKGIPLIDVEQDYATNYITITQAPFVSLQLEEEKTNEIEKLGWIIPVSYTTEKEMNFENTKISGWLTPEKPLVLYVENMKIDQWIVLNLKFNVLGHVNYTPHNWQEIKNRLHDSQRYSNFDVSTRVRFIHDIMALAESGKLSYTFAFNTLKYLKHEEHPLPLRAALHEFDIIYSRLLRSEKSRLLFTKYVRHIMEDFYLPKFISLGQIKFLESDYEDYRHKILIVEASCKYGVYRCADGDARKLSQAWSMGKLPKKPRELRKIILCQAVKHDNKYMYTSTFLYDDYMTDQNKPNDWAEDLIDALCCSEHENVMQTLLKATIQDTGMYRYDIFRVFKCLSTNPRAYALLKNYFMTHYSTIDTYFSNDSIVNVWSYMKVLIEMTKTTTEIDEITDFATSVQINWETREIKETIFNAKKKIMWLNSFEAYVDENSRDLASIKAF